MTTTLNRIWMMWESVWRTRGSIYASTKRKYLKYCAEIGLKSVRNLTFISPHTLYVSSLISGFFPRILCKMLRFRKLVTNIRHHSSHYKYIWYSFLKRILIPTSFRTFKVVSVLVGLDGISLTGHVHCCFVRSIMAPIAVNLKYVYSTTEWKLTLWRESHVVTFLLFGLEHIPRTGSIILFT